MGHKEKNRCFLSDKAHGATAASTEYDYWQSKWDGLAAAVGKGCMHLGDYLALKTAEGGDWQAKMEVRKNLGSLYVTRKVDVGVDYIATPGESTSLEVTGDDLSWGSDRVMVIDCYGTCGITKGTTFAKMAGTDAGVDFDEWVPVNAAIDRPSLQENPMAPADPVTFTTYTTLEKQYCPGNLALPEGSLAAKHQCYHKCYAEAPCVDGSEDGDSACFCGGYISGYDDADSAAVCLNEIQCQYLCDVTEGCHSIDMSTDKTRCYLNTETCNDYVQDGTTHPDKEYKIMVKPLDDNTRRLEAKGRAMTAKHARQLLAAQDPKISWGGTNGILRYKGMQFSSGGEFKLCFCDSDLLTGTNEICDGPEDYTIEVGSVHATGLQCLLSNPKMTRGTCEKQEYGGLRCYDDAVPTVDVPVEFLGVPNPSGHAWTDHTKQLIAFCRHSTEEEAMQFEFCKQWRD